MPGETKSARHVYNVYLYGMCLVAVLILLFSAASAVYAIVRIAAPGVTARGAFGGGALSFLGSLTGAFGGGSSFERDLGVVQLVQSGVLALGAGLAFAVHWRWANEMRLEDEAAAATAAKPSPRRRTPRKSGA